MSAGGSMSAKGAEWEGIAESMGWIHRELWENGPEKEKI